MEHRKRWGGQRNDKSGLILWEDKENQLSSGEKNPGAEIQIFQMFLLSGKHADVYLKQILLWPSEQSHSDTQRHFFAPAVSSDRHVPHHTPFFFSPFPPPPLPHFLSTQFFFPPSSSNCKHMRSVSTSCCQASSLENCCFSPLSSALWHAVRFISAVKGVPVKEFRSTFCSETHRSTDSCLIKKNQRYQPFIFVVCAVSESIMTQHPDSACRCPLCHLWPFLVQVPSRLI